MRVSLENMRRWWANDRGTNGNGKGEKHHPEERKVPKTHKAEEEKDGEWHAHHKVSKPLPPKSKLWVELETSAGKQMGSFELPKK